MYLCVYIVLRQSEGSHPEEGGDSQQLAEATGGGFFNQTATATNDFLQGLLTLLRCLDVTAGAI